MRRLAVLLIVAAMAFGGLTQHIVMAGDGCAPADPDTGGTPPCCSRVDKYVNMPEVAAQAEAEMIADPQHEYMIVVDCLTGRTLIHAIGTLYEVNWRTSLFTTSNQLMIHSHPLSTMPSIEDMQNLYSLNPLQFRLVGFDHASGYWSRCTFTKPDYRELWPEINEVGYRQMRATAAQLYGLSLGDEATRRDQALKTLWTTWSAAHGIPMMCERIT